MLLYHFATRDALLRAIVVRARQRQLEAFRTLLRLRPDEPYTTTLERAWTAIAGPDGQPWWPEFRRSATTDRLGPLEDGLRTVGRPEFATLVLAVIRGLLMDLDATGDHTRVDRAFRDFLTVIGSGV